MYVRCRELMPCRHYLLHILKCPPFCQIQPGDGGLVLFEATIRLARGVLG